MKRKLKKKQTKGAVKMPKTNTYLNENSKLIVESAIVMHSTRDDVRDELSNLAGFQDFARESRGNSLTFGDY
jgi:hypothetical protein